jgi:hypothetical protein
LTLSLKLSHSHGIAGAVTSDVTNQDKSKVSREKLASGFVLHKN